MPAYMVQKMSSGLLIPITYYRKQSAHPSHEESGQFTTDARNAYAQARSISVDAVEAGTYKSGQGVPAGGETVQI